MPLDFQQWDEEHEKIFNRIKNNDETLSRLNIIFYSRTDGSSLHYSAVMCYIREYPNDFENALRTNINITNMEIEMHNLRELLADVENFTYYTHWRGPAEALAKAMGSMRSLHHLTIDGQDAFEDEQRNDLVIDTYLQNVRQISTLHFKLGFVCNERNAHTLDQALRNHPNLESFEYEMEDGNDLPFPFRTSLQTLPRLQKICLRSDTEEFDVTDHFEFPILSGFPILACIPTLNEISCKLIELDGASANDFAQTIENNPTIVSLEVTAPPEVVFFAKTASAIKRNLISLKLRVHHRTDYMERNGHYRHFFLDDHRHATYSLGLSHLLQSMMLSDNLKNLTLDDFDWGLSHHIQLLQGMLQEMSSLEYLSLRFQPGGISGDTWFSLAASIGRNTTLKALDVDFSYMNDEISSSDFCRGNAELANCRTLDSCEFSVVHSMDLFGIVRDFVCCLGVHSNIRTLDVNGHRSFNPEGFSKIVEAIQTNYCLEHIDLHCFNQPEGILDLDKSMNVIWKLNETGRSYTIDDRGRKIKGVELLARIAGEPVEYQFWHRELSGVGALARKYLRKEDIRLDCLFFHLRENPSLCDTQH